MKNVKAGDLIKEKISGFTYKVSAVLDTCVFCQHVDHEYVQRLEFDDFETVTSLND